jgi:hypothetical protein
VSVAAHLFFQCIMVCRCLPQARGSGFQSFSCPLCFTSAILVSSVSAMSLIRGARATCVCVPVTILDLLLPFLWLVSGTAWSKGSFYCLSSGDVFG